MNSLGSRVGSWVHGPSVPRLWTGYSLIAHRSSFITRGGVSRVYVMSLSLSPVHHDCVRMRVRVRVYVYVYLLGVLVVYAPYVWLVFDVEPCLPFPSLPFPSHAIPFHQLSDVRGIYPESDLDVYGWLGEWVRVLDCQSVARWHTKGMNER